MAAIQTQPTDADVTDFLDAVPDERRRAEGHELRALLAELTGDPGRLWGPSIVGFGDTSYTNTTGTHPWFVVGFSPRKTALTLYGLSNDYADPDPLLDRLGPHTTGKGCLYLKRLDAVDTTVLSDLVRQALQADRATG